MGAAGLGVYLFAVFQGRSGARSTIGTGFGGAAVSALLVVMIYSVRRSLPSVRALGRTRHYLDLHLYAGVLFLLFFAFHIDFSMPAGWLTGTLWLVTVWVIVTGALGTGLQRWIPKVLDDTSTIEVPFQRIPTLVEEIRIRCEQVAATDPRVQAFYEREMAGEMARIRSAIAVQPGRTVAQTFRSDEIQTFRSTLDAKGEDALASLQKMHATKLDLDRHFALQSLLRGWLYLHLPVAVVLIGLVAVHVFMVLYF